MVQRRDVDDVGGVADDDFDDEEFCARCYAGVDSSEHHEKCVLSGHAEDGESAPENDLYV